MSIPSSSASASICTILGFLPPKSCGVTTVNPLPSDSL